MEKVSKPNNDKYVIRFFPDWQCTFLWSGDDKTAEKFGYNIVLDKLPLSEETIKELERLSQWYDTSLNWDDPMGPSPWTTDEYIEFKEALKEILLKIRSELKEEFEIKDEVDFSSM